MTSFNKAHPAIRDAITHRATIVKQQLAELLGESDEVKQVLDSFIAGVKADLNGDGGMVLPEIKEEVPAEPANAKRTR